MSSFKTASGDRIDELMLPSNDPVPRIVEDELYLVWSNEHRGWWRSNRMGYTDDIRSAGRYPREEALGISRWLGENEWRQPKGVPDELPIRLADVPKDLLS